MRRTGCLPWAIALYEESSTSAPMRCCTSPDASTGYGKTHSHWATPQI